MSSRTPNFGLSYFGGATPGSISDDGGKYTGGDRLLLDKILAALAANDGHVHALSTDVPTDEPDLDLGTDTGTLPAGQSFFYEVTFVSTDGLETVAGDENTIDTPDILPQPAAPSAETDTVGGHTLPSGLWIYAVTALRGVEESVLSPAFNVTVLAGENTVNLTLPALGDADHYRVWRMGLNEAGFTKLGTSATGTFVDDGTIPSNPCPTDPSNQPPQENAGINRYSVTVTLSTADQALINNGHFRSWRVYRTDVSGQYTAVSLVHEVIERVDELDPTSDLLVAWIDDGDDLVDGTPPEQAETLALQPFAIETFTTDPPTTGYPDGYPIFVGTAGSRVLKLMDDGAWTAITGGGGGGAATVLGMASTWTTHPALIDTTTHAFLVPLCNAARPPYDTEGQSNQFYVPNGFSAAAFSSFQGVAAVHLDLELDVSGATAGDVIQLGTEPGNWLHGTLTHVITADEVGFGAIQLAIDYSEVTDSTGNFIFQPWITGPATCLLNYVQWSLAYPAVSTTPGFSAAPKDGQPMVSVNYTDDGTDATVTWDAGGTPPGTPTPIAGTALLSFYWLDLNGNGPVDSINPTAAWNAATVTVPLPTTPGSYVLYCDGPSSGGRAWLAQPVWALTV